MTGITDNSLTCDDFLDGRLRLFQPRQGYRAGADPVFLAASVPAKPGQSVLELGCGAGAAILCLATRAPGLNLTGVELQPLYADLARRNAALNGIDLQVAQADLAALPPELRQRQYDHVLANPPYFRPGAHTGARDAGRRVALGESETPLDLWFQTAARRLAPGGYLHMIQRVDRLPEMLAACHGRLGSPQVLPLAARETRAPDLVILRARKGGRAGFRLHAPLILHAGDRHLCDKDSYRPEITDILRHAHALIWPV